MKTIDIIDQYMLEYSYYTIMHRAVPYLLDGLKPSQRMVMEVVKNINSYEKSNTVAGKVMLIHPHGDCLEGNTQMYMLDGTFKTLKELEEEGGTHWVLASDENQNIVPAKAFGFRKVKKVDKITQITFSNGHILRATKDHKFKLTNGEWLECKDLKEGMILDYAMLNKDYKGDYLNIRGTKTKKTKLHQLIGRSLYGELDKGYIIHHLDNNKLNNTPNNLKKLTRREHSLLHYNTNNREPALEALEKGRITMALHAEERRERNSQIMKQVNQKQPLIRACKGLELLEERGEELTLENYELLRKNKDIYNLTTVEKLIEKGHISSFENLVEQYKKGIKFVNYIKSEKDEKPVYAKTKEHVEQCKKGLNKARYITFMLKTASKNNYDKKIIFGKKYYNEVKNELPIITNTEVIEVEEQYVYDFTVEQHHNAFILLSNKDSDNILLGVAHNCYPTIVNMIQKDSNNYPLILGKGSFSSRTTRDGVPASSRYTECKVSEMGKLFTQNKDEIDYIPSYDNKTTIPVCFSPDLPMILINGQQGIATGFSINIPQYNLIDVCTQTINLLQGKSYSHIFPDFSTGGYINNSPCTDSSSMRYTLRGKCEVDGDGVTITEIPYYTTREEIIEKIEELSLSGVMKSVKDVEDLSGKDGLCIYVSLKRGANAEEFVNQLCSLTSFQSSFTTNIGYIHNNSLIYTGVEELLRNWIELKTANIIKGTKKKLENIEEKLEISEAFRKTVDCVKDLPKFILDLPEEEVVKELMDKKGLTEKQAIFISELGIKYFRENYFYKKINEAKDLYKEKDKLLHIVKTGGKEELIQRLTKIMETWGGKRKTVIEDITLSKKELPKIEDNYKGYVYLTKNGFIYKTNVKSPNLTPGDEVINVSYISKSAEVLIFDKEGSCYKFYTEDIENCGKGVGYYTGVENMVGGTIITETTNSVLLIYEDGRVARVEADSFRTTTKRKKLGNSLYLDAKLIHVTSIYDEDVAITLQLEKGHQKVVDVNSLTIKKQRNTRGIQLTKRKIIGVN